MGWKAGGRFSADPEIALPSREKPLPPPHSLTPRPRAESSVHGWCPQRWACGALRSSLPLRWCFPMGSGWITADVTGLKVRNRKNITFLWAATSQAGFTPIFERRRWWAGQPAFHLKLLRFPPLKPESHQWTNADFYGTEQPGASPVKGPPPRAQAEGTNSPLQRWLHHMEKKGFPEGEEETLKMFSRKRWVTFKSTSQAFSSRID